MPKLDVGVGDEFPAEEKGQVHHHYYHFERGRRLRRPFRLLRLLRLLRLILSLMLIVCVVKLVGFAWMAPDWLEPYGVWLPHGLYRLGSVLCAIAVIGGVLWLLRRQDKD